MSPWAKAGLPCGQGRSHAMDNGGKKATGRAPRIARGRPRLRWETHLLLQEVQLRLLLLTQSDQLLHLLAHLLHLRQATAPRPSRHVSPWDRTA